MIRPSILVPASIFLIKKILKKPLDLNQLIKEFNTDEKKVKSCAKILAVMLSKESNSKLTACRRKFNSDKFNNVSRIKISVKDVKENQDETLKTERDRSIPHGFGTPLSANNTYLTSPLGYP